MTSENLSVSSAAGLVSGRIFISRGISPGLEANVSFFPSDAKKPDSTPVDPKRDRPLAGQSPYIINGGLLYSGKSLGLNLTYNRFGKRIVFASRTGQPMEFEKPRDLLDFQISYKIGKRKQAEVKLNISDLLNQELIYYKNQFAPDNPFGFVPGYTSVERYPGAGERYSTATKGSQRHLFQQRLRYCSPPVQIRHHLYPQFFLQVLNISQDENHVFFVLPVCDGNWHHVTAKRRRYQRCWIWRVADPQPNLPAMHPRC